MDTRLQELLYPDSIALIGVSADPEKRAGRPIRYLKQWYDGDIYPINPNHDEIVGFPCHANVQSVGKPIDLAIITLPAPIVADTLRECGKAGIENAIVISAGFAEVGEEGAKRQAELAAVADKYDITMLGPNCLGLMNYWNGMAACYKRPTNGDDLLTGNVAIVSQSGALGGVIAEIAQYRSIGIGYMVSSGNEATLSSVDFLENFIDDDRVGIIATYLEGINDGDRFRNFAQRAAEAEIPIVVRKSGRSTAGSEAATTHTASMTGEYGVFEGIFRQFGLIPVDSTHELLDSLQLFQKGTFDAKNVGVISTSGAAGIEIADFISDTDLQLPDFDVETAERLAAVCGERVHIRNPLDLAAALDPDEYDDVIRNVGDSPNVDIVLQFNTKYGAGGRTSAEHILEGAESVDKPVAVVWPIPRALCDGGHELLESNGVPVFPSIDRAVTAFEQMNRYREFLKTQDGTAQPQSTGDATVDPSAFGAEEGSVLGEFDAKELLRRFDLSTPVEELVDDRREAAEAAKRIGPEVVMKVVSPDIPHRHTTGLVRVGVDADNAAEVYDDLLATAHDASPTADIEGVLLQELVDADEAVEIIVGAVDDAVFGSTMMIAPGGIAAEAAQRTAHRVTPLTQGDVDSMLEEIDVETMTGHADLALDELKKTIHRISRIVEANDWIDELDCNPIIVTADDAVIVDALIRAQ